MADKLLAIVPIWDNNKSMRVIAISTLRQFWEIHPDAEQPIKAWFDEASKATWTQPSDVKAHYGNSSILKKSPRCI